MAENEQQSDTTPRRTWKHKLKTAWRVFDVLLAFAWVLVFIWALLTGYLSWIGIAVGAVFGVLKVGSSILELVAKKRFKNISFHVSVGLTLLVAFMIAAARLWPEKNGDDSWRPYRFDDELAAIEAKRTVPDEDNAAIRYESVFATIDFNDRPDFVFRMREGIHPEPRRRPWKGSDYPQASQWLDKHSEVINDLLRIGRMEKCRWPIQADIFDDYTVPYDKLRHSVQLLIAAGMRDLGEDRLQRALEKFFCVLHMAEHMYQQTQCIDFLFGLACEGTALEAIRYSLVLSNVSQQDAELIAEHLLSLENPWLQVWSRILESDKLQYMNLLARVYEVNDEGDIRFVAGYAFSNKDGQTHEIRGKEYRWLRIYHLINMPLDPKGVRGMADRYFTRFDYLREPGCIPQLGEDQEISFRSPGTIIKLLCNLYRWGVETMMFDGEQYIRPRYLYNTHAARRRGTWLVLGLRKYKNSYGQWPEELNLISEYAPSEAFTDPTNGDKFIYARDGDNFKLYGKGFNGLDEGGRGSFWKRRSEEGDDIAIWPLTERKTGGADND
ncbi:MAG: hypothetical protein ACYTBX_18040 [Planctomycetota bacterium]|jgi:hypothetical protein